MALETFPGPELYDARTRSQSPKILYILVMYCAAAALAFSGSLLSSTYESICKLYCFPVWYINCQSPVAPILETAFGFNADSTTARYFISRGTFCFARASSNIGK